MRNIQAHTNVHTHTHTRNTRKCLAKSRAPKAVPCSAVTPHHVCSPGLPHSTRYCTFPSALTRLASRLKLPLALPSGGPPPLSTDSARTGRPHAVLSVLLQEEEEELAVLEEEELLLVAVHPLLTLLESSESVSASSGSRLRWEPRSFCLAGVCSSGGGAGDGSLRFFGGLPGLARGCGGRGKSASSRNGLLMPSKSGRGGMKASRKVPLSPWSQLPASSSLLKASRPLLPFCTSALLLRRPLGSLHGWLLLLP